MYSLYYRHYSMDFLINQQHLLGIHCCVLWLLELQLDQLKCILLYMTTIGQFVKSTVHSPYCDKIKSVDLKKFSYYI